MIDMLTEYGNLQAAIDKPGANKTDLEKQQLGLSNDVKEKNQLVKEIDKLAAEKSTLTAVVKDLEGMVKVKDQVVATKSKLTELQLLKTEHEELNGKIAELNKSFAEKCNQFKLFQAFLGFLQNTTTEAMVKFVALAPEMVQWAKQGKYSPNEIKRTILIDLTMGQMNIYACMACRTSFFVDSAPTRKGKFSCPNCNSAEVEVQTDTYDVIGQMAGKTDQGQAIFTLTSKHIKK